MEAEAKTIKKEMKTGVHLVTITDASIVKDNSGNPVVTKDQETGIKIRFTNAKEESFDKVFWLNGPRHKEFVKMITSAQINPSATKFKAEAKGKRLWIYVKEVWDIDGEEIVNNDVTGEPVINYYIFDFTPCINPENRPAVIGDPEMNNGRPGGKFIDYNQIVKTTSTTEDNFPIAEAKPSALTPNESFAEETFEQPEEETQEEGEIDFDNF